MRSLLKKLLNPTFTFFMGILLASATTIILAHGGNISLIHGCVKNNNGDIRIVGASDNCAGNETALDWEKPKNIPFFCQRCNLENELGNRLAGKDLTDAYLPETALNGGNFQNTNFTNAYMLNVGFSDADFTGAKFIGANMCCGAHFVNTLLTNADLTNAILTSDDFTNTNLISANLTNADLTNSWFDGSNLTGATGLDTANLANVAWFNTICPDGTNSDNNGNTCEGHL